MAVSFDRVSFDCDIPPPLPMIQYILWISKGQLWRLQVASKEDRELVSEERSDEELSEVSPRQLGGSGGV